jgi:hypothetical protein
VMFTRALLGLKQMGIRANALCPEVFTMPHVLSITRIFLGIIYHPVFLVLCWKLTCGNLGEQFIQTPFLEGIPPAERNFVNRIGYVTMERVIEGKTLVST